MDKNNIPITGRIAIIDDNIDEAKPLMREFAQNNIPYVYFNGEESFFPNQPDNDIRILFLDINLLGQSAIDYKNIKSKLVNVIRKVISPNNYPYILIYWSIQEREYDSVIREVFDTVLSDRRPISIHRFIKSDFFLIPGGEEQPTEKRIVEELGKIIREDSPYDHLMQWENIAHASSDILLKELLPNSEPDEWKARTEYVISSLGKANLGQHYENSNYEERIKAGFIAINLIYNDTLETNISLCNITSQQRAEGDISAFSTEDLVANINHKLLMSEYPKDICEPGAVFQYNDIGKGCFGELLNKVLSLLKIRQVIRTEKKGIEESVLKKEASERLKNIRKEIEKTWIKIGIVVTPSCDYAQKKKVIDRVVQGVIIDSKYKDYLNTGDAFFTSPVFQYKDTYYVFVINYNYFITDDLSPKTNINLLFKLRRPCLAEIQSKLARHISRQGIMNL